MFHENSVVIAQRMVLVRFRWHMYSKIILSYSSLIIILRKQFSALLNFCFTHVYNSHLLLYIFIFHRHLCEQRFRCLFYALNRNRLLYRRRSNGLSFYRTYLGGFMNYVRWIKQPVFTSKNNPFFLDGWLRRRIIFIGALTYFIWVTFSFYYFLFCFVTI